MLERNIRSAMPLTTPPPEASPSIRPTEASQRRQLWARMTVWPRMFAGWTPLHHSAARGDASAVEALLRAGAEVGATDTTAATPLHLAAERGHAMPAFLLASRAPAACRSHDASNATPPDLAHKQKHGEVRYTCQSHESFATLLRQRCITRNRNRIPSGRTRSSSDVCVLCACQCKMFPLHKDIIYLVQVNAPKLHLVIVSVACGEQLSRAADRR